MKTLLITTFYNIIKFDNTYMFSTVISKFIYKYNELYVKYVISNDTVIKDYK